MMLRRRERRRARPSRRALVVVGSVLAVAIAAAIVLGASPWSVSASWPWLRAATPAAPVYTGPPASGLAMPTDDGSQWRRVLADDFLQGAPSGSFPGRAYDRRWTVYDGQRDTSGAGKYSAKALSVHGGVLDAHVSTQAGQPVSTAAVPLVTGSWGGQQYGRFSVRFRADPVPGYKVAWLLWPDSEKWKDGEVDFPEGPLDATIGAYDHCVGDPMTNCFEADTRVAFTSWHTATIEWTPSGLTFVLDGSVVGTSSAAPKATMHWVLQTETDRGTPPRSSSGHVLVDWVTIDAWVPGE